MSKLLQKISPFKKKSVLGLTVICRTVQIFFTFCLFGIPARFIVLSFRVSEFTETGARTQKPPGSKVKGLDKAK